MEALFFIFPAIFVTLIVLTIVFGVRNSDERVKALKAYAEGNGLRFSGDKDFSFDERYHTIQCLHRGSSRYAFNLLFGEWEGYEMTCFDYHYETESRDSDGKTKKTSHYFSGVLIETDYRFKSLSISPESLFSGTDIDFESAEFSKMFHVTADERKWAYDVIHPRMMEYLMKYPEHSIELNGKNILVRKFSRMDAEDYPVAADLACGMIKLLPEFVLRELESGRA